MSPQRVNFRFGPQLKNYGEGLIASFGIDLLLTIKKAQAKENQEATSQEISLDRKGTFQSIFSDPQLVLLDLVPCFENCTLENKLKCKGEKEFSHGSLNSLLLNHVKCQENRKLSRG